MGHANWRTALILVALSLLSDAQASELLWKQRPRPTPGSPGAISGAGANATGGNAAGATIGNSAGAAVRVDGFGVSMPVMDAITAVVPQEYKVEWSQGIRLGSDQVVNWDGRGRFWTDVLSDITAAAQFEFTVVDSRVIISANGGGAERPPALSPFEAKAGETVKVTLSRWSAVAGWRLDWQASHDAIIEFGATFGDDFEASVDQLFEGFSGTNPKFDPWKADNQVLIVRTESKL